MEGAMGRYLVTRMTLGYAQAITRWRYQPPFSLYDLEPGDEAMLLDPELRYHAVLGRSGGLAGFACFGDDAQVIGGSYADGALDIGFGMAPELTGHGHGEAFVQAICSYAWRSLNAGCLRLSVATFNQRAVTVYRRLGFRSEHCFVGTTRHGALSFVIMTRPAPRG